MPKQARRPNLKKHLQPVPKKKPTPYHPKFAVDAFELARAGKSNADIAAHLGVSTSAMTLWSTTKEEFGYALTKGRTPTTEGGSAHTLETYIYAHLPPTVKPLWDKIAFWLDADDVDFANLTQFLTGYPAPIRQRLYVHALVHTTFNTTKAMTITGVTKVMLDNWVRTDPDFRAMMDEMNWHKKNFFEQGVIDLVKARDATVVKFANQTINSDRGYGKTILHQHTGTVNHTHTLVPAAAIAKHLPLDQRVALLEGLRAAKAELGIVTPGMPPPLPKPPAIEAELVADEDDRDEEDEA